VLKKNNVPFGVLLYPPNKRLKYEFLNAHAENRRIPDELADFPAIHRLSSAPHVG
jgi:hypothetical protein